MRNQAEILEYHTDSTAHLGNFVLLQLSHIEAVDDDGSLCGLDLTGEKLRNGRFTGTGRSNQKNEFPFIYCNVNMIQSFRLAALIHHADIFHFNHIRISS